MNQDELEKEAEEAYKKIDDGTGFYMGETYFIDGYIEGSNARQKELDEAVEVIRLIALTENNNYLAKEFLAKVKRG
jgi:hypothetical protein